MAKKTFNLRDAVLTIGDGDSPQNTFTVVLDEGDLVLDIPQRETKDIRDRGEFDHLRKGSPRPMGVSFSAKFSGFNSSGGDTLYDVLTGNGTSWVYSAITGAGYDLADGGDVDLIQLQFVITKDSTAETVLIPNIPLPEISFREGDDVNSLSFNGTSYQELPIITEA